MNAMATYKLTYFAIRGRTEPLRYILAYSGEKWEDNRIPDSQWPELKQTLPMGQLPMLEVNGKQLFQSITIARYLAKKFGLVPENDWDAARADMLVDGVSDVRRQVYPVILAIRAGDESKRAEAWASFKDDSLPVFLKAYEKLLQNNGTGFFVGNKITWADIIVAEVLDRIITLCDSSSFLDGYSGLNGLMQRVHEVPNIKKYLLDRPKTKL